MLLVIGTLIFKMVKHHVVDEFSELRRRTHSFRHRKTIRQTDKMNLIVAD